MSDPKRPTMPVVSLINAHTNPPASGQRVLALQRGGVLVMAQWGRDSINYFDAWMHYPDVPDDVKLIQQERLKTK